MHWKCCWFLIISWRRADRWLVGWLSQKQNNAVQLFSSWSGSSDGIASLFVISSLLCSKPLTASKHVFNDQSYESPREDDCHNMVTWLFVTTGNLVYSQGSIGLKLRKRSPWTATTTIAESLSRQGAVYVWHSTARQCRPEASPTKETVRTTQSFLCTFSRPPPCPGFGSRGGWKAPESHLLVKMPPTDTEGKSLDLQIQNPAEPIICWNPLVGPVKFSLDRHFETSWNKAGQTLSENRAC